MRLHRSALLAGLAIFITALLASSAQAQTIVRCRTTGGSLVDCTTPLLNTYINWGSPSAIGGTAPAAVTGTTITATAQFSGPATGLTGIPGGQITGSLSGVTINCASNTCSNVSLTAAVTGILPIANGGTGQASLTNHGVLLGQGNSGLISPALGSAGHVLTSNGASSDPSFQSPVTANIATAVATTTTLADTSGTYTDVTGATLSLAAGTHIVSATLRAEIGATTGAGAFIVCRLHDGTNPISNTETLITQANQLLVLAQNTTTLVWPITVGSTTSVKAQCARVFSGVLFTSDIPSDSNGRSRMFSVQTAP